jgi:hypothetical protein
MKTSRFLATFHGTEVIDGELNLHFKYSKRPRRERQNRIILKLRKSAEQRISILKYQ